MISIILSIIGATFIYGGMLMFPKDSNAGIASALVGLVLIVKPVWDAVRRFRSLSGVDISKTDRRGRNRGKKPHLKLVSSDTKKNPTIH